MAAVVDKDHLVRDAHLIERGVEPREQRRQPGLFVIDRDDD
jgi:hypothetical protein